MMYMVRNLWPWMGLLITLFVSSLSTYVAGAAPRERNQVFARLDQSRVYGQTFMVEYDQLAAIRVLLFPPREPLDDLVTLRLHYPDDNLPDLAYVTLPVQSIASNGMTTFTFDPVRLQPVSDRSNLTLQFTIEAPTLAIGNGITVIGGPDTYAAGQLFINGKPDQGADLAFQPLYRMRWFDRILPISRMADGKPGMLGWPPFYALLVYAYGYILFRVIVRMWQTVR